MSNKTAFVSYAYGNKSTESLALKIADGLHSSGVDTLFDKWDLKLGDDKNYFMEQIQSKDFVLVVCDENYHSKSNSRTGGVGTETQIIAGKVYENIKNSRIIPIVADSRKNIPIFLENRMSIDFSDSTMFDKKLEELLRHIYEEPENKKPILGTRPSFSGNTKDEPKKIRSIEKIISAYLDINSNEQLIGDKVGVKNWSQKIIFEFYKLTNKLTGANTNFLYFYESSTQSKVVEYIRDHKLHDETKEKLIVLTDKPKDVKEPKERLENLKQIFKTQIFFIEDFCYEYLYKEFLQSKFEYSKFEIRNFIASQYVNGEDALKELDVWYKQDNEPIIVVKGFGGVGKTTLTRFFLDKIYEEKQHKISILYIDSASIVQHVKNIIDANDGGCVNDIYYFYQANCKKQEVELSRHDSNLIKLSVDNGDLIVVIDGLDEVITRLGDKFDVKTLLQSIKSNYSSDGEKGKVIITCRDYFWDSQDISIKNIELIPFDKNQMQKYFQSAFGSDTRKIKNAEKLAHSFSANVNNQERFIPYVLDTIKYLMSDESKELNLEEKLNSKVLSSKVKNDFLVSAICNRESIKLDNLSVDQQINIFIKMGIKNNGAILSCNFATLFDGCQISQTAIDGFKSHPLLRDCGENSTFTFRYDFFWNYFKNLYVASILRGEHDGSSLNSDIFVEIINNNINYCNNFTRDLCERIQLDDDSKLNAMTIIENLRKANNQKVKKAISSIFLYLMTSYVENQKSTIADFTELALEIFGKGDGKIEGLCIVDLLSNNSTKPIFNFKDTVLSNCYFSNYEYFWECLMNENTQFTSSILKNLKPRKNVNPKIFDNLIAASCETGEDIKDLINDARCKIEDSKKNLESKIKNIFKFFFDSGRFVNRTAEKVEQKFGSDFIKILLDLDILESFKDSVKATLGIQYRVSTKYNNVKKVFEGNYSVELDEAVNLVYSESTRK